jgi:hypothetical protein
MYDKRFFFVIITIVPSQQKIHGSKKGSKLNIRPEWLLVHGSLFMLMHRICKRKEIWRTDPGEITMQLEGRRQSPVRLADGGAHP